MSQPITEGVAYAHEKRSVAGLAAIYMLRLLGMYMVLPVLALYAATLPGHTPILVGLAVGSYGLAQALLQVPFGVWSDRYGRRRVIGSGLFLFTLGSVVAALAPNVVWLIVGRTLQGAGGIAAAVVAFIADVTRPQARAQAMAVLGASVGVAFAIGMISGPSLAARFGVTGLFWFTAALSAVALLYISFGIPRPPRHVHDSTVEWTPGFLREVAMMPAMRRLDIGATLLHTMVTCMFVVGPGRLERYLPVEEHGKVYLVLVPIGLILMAGSAAVADRWGRLREAILAGSLFLIVGGVGLIYAPEAFWSIILATGCTIAAVAVAEPAAPAMVTRLARDEARGTAAGAYHMCEFSGSFFGGLAGGLLLHWPHALGWVLAGGAAVWFLLAAGLPRLRRLED
jgi:MFS family permease